MGSATDALKNIQTAAATPVVRPQHVVIRTADRPASLNVLLESAVHNQQRYGGSWQYLVVDDSVRVDSDQQNQKIVSDMQSKGLDIHYLGRSWLKAFASWCQSNVSANQALLEWLAFAEPQLHSTGSGRIWNVAMLLLSGKPFLRLDDQLSLNAMRWPDSNNQLEVGPVDVIPLRCAQNVEMLQSFLSHTEHDPLALHADLLGQDLNTVLDQLGQKRLDSTVLRGLDGEFVNRMLNNEPVLTTSAGVYGDYRQETALWLYLQPPEHNAYLWQSQDIYYQSLNRPIAAQGYAHPYLSQTSEMPVTAMDASRFLPFIPPTGQGEDFGFSMLARYLYPHAPNLHVPDMLLHQKAAASQKPQAHTYVPWFSRFIGESAYQQSDQCVAEHPLDRMLTLGAQLRDVAASSTAHKKTVIRQYLTHMRANIIEQFQNASTQAGQQAPAYWQADVKNWIGEHAKVLTETEGFKFADWPNQLSDDAYAQHFSDQLERYAEAAEFWPEIWQACEGRFEQLLALK